MNNAAMAQADVSQRFALDTQGFEALKQSARQGASANTLKSAARQFEAVFTQMVLKSMRDATPQDGVFDNEQTKLYMSMFDQQLSQQLSTRGIGLADVMVRQLARAPARRWRRTRPPWQPPACRAGRARRPPRKRRCARPCRRCRVRRAASPASRTMARHNPGTRMPRPRWARSSGRGMESDGRRAPVPGAGGLYLAGRQRHRELRQRRRTGPCERLPAAHEARRRRPPSAPAACRRN